VRPENLILCDSRGVIHRGRSEGMNPYKAQFAVDTSARSLADALRGADVFVGVSSAGVVTGDMIESMAPKPVVFAMANPDPEISPDVVRRVRPDAIVATGRSDYPNQVNNVLGFPFIFRGALDVRAKAINEEMKVAAAYSLATLAKKGADESVAKAYGKKHFDFGPEYIVPSPFDPRVLVWESVAVAEAAMHTGASSIKIDIEEYREQLSRKVEEKLKRWSG